MRDYISVSGITSPEETRELFLNIRHIAMKKFIAQGYNFAHKDLVIGYQFSHKSIYEGPSNSRQLRIENTYQLMELNQFLGFDAGLHYYTKDFSTIIDDLDILLNKNKLSNFVTMLQFNTKTPIDVDILRDIKNEYNQRIIFKVPVEEEGVNIIEKKDYTLDQLVQLVEERGDYIDYAMYDPSHGTGTEMDLNKATAFGKEMKKLHKNIVLAGGFNPKNIEASLDRIILELGQEFSIDAEGGLRDKLGEGYGNDKFNPDKAGMYLNACIRKLI